MIIAIDWDHTLMNGDKWLPGAQDALRSLYEAGHNIIIHSCNSADWIESQLNEEGLSNLVSEICAERDYRKFKGTSDPKPVADIYIDDRGYRFPRNGSWIDEFPKVLETLEQERIEEL